MVKRRRQSAGRGGSNGKSVFEAQAAFRLALRQFLHFSESTARSAGLTQQQYQALLAVYVDPGHDSIRVGELASRLQIRHHSAVGLVDRLVARGLVIRERAESDRRIVQLVVTARGRRLLRRVSAKNRQELRRLRPELIGFLRRLGSLA